MAFESLHNGQPQPDRLFEARIVLLRAEAESDARQRAEVLGRAAEERYENPDGEQVTWAFRELLDIKELFIDRLEDGGEVYWEFLSEHELDAVRNMLRAPLPEVK
jgi:hypothetical protein